jgi:general secretion pathway protein L
MQTLFLYVEADDLTRASWTSADAALTQRQTILHGDLAELKNAAEGKQIIVITPAADVLQTEIQLPPKLSRQRLLKALPFAMEEQLLTDVADLHFAAGTYGHEGMVPVAIVNNSKMQTWSDALRAAGIYPAAIVSAVLAVPFVENCWNVFIFANTAILRTGLHTGLSCDRQNLADLLVLEAAAKTQKPQAIYIHNYTDTPAAVAADALNIIEKNSPAEQFLEDIAANWSAPAVNLAQGAYLVKRNASQYKKIWQLAGLLMAGWLATILIGNLVSLLILQHASGTLNKQISLIYQRNFPSAKSVVAPKERMTEKLNNSLQGNKNHLMALLAFLGESMQQRKNIHILRLEFRDNQLLLDITTDNFGDIDELAQALVQQGLVVKQQNVATAGKDVKGTLIITENSA